MCVNGGILLRASLVANWLAPVSRMRNTLAMRSLCRIFAGVCALFLMQGAAFAKDRLTIFAAASLKGALDAAIKKSGVDAAVSYAGSGLIARQVVQGAPADIVLLAHADWMEWMTSRLDVSPLQSHIFLSNELVLIAPMGSAELTGFSTDDLLDRLGENRLAVGQTQGVPAGIYARQWLEHIGAWSEMQPRLAETDNVRAALALVAREQTPLGLVYASDAQAEASVRVLYTIPSEAHDAITYPMVVLDTKNAGQATEFASFLMADEAQTIFREHGFLTAGSPS